jgi:hypothetical protein
VSLSTLDDDKFETRCASHARLGLGPGLDVVETFDVRKVKKKDGGDDLHLNIC